MPITLGNGVITGLNAGGLPDTSVTPEDFETSFNLTGKSVLFGTNGFTETGTFSLSVNGNFSADTWYGFVTNSIPSGTYYITLYMDTYFSAGSQYDMLYVSVPFWYFAGSSNNNQTFELPTLYGNGHTNNQVNPLRFRIRERFGSDGASVFLDWLAPGYGLSSVNGTGGRNVQIYLTRLCQ